VSFNTKAAIGLTIFATLAIYSVFVPWAESRYESIGAWYGYLSLGGVRFYGRYLIVAAAAIAVFSWLRAGDVWLVRPAIPYLLASAGFIASAYTLYLFATIDRYNMMDGGFLSTAAFGGMLLILVKQSLRAKATQRAEES
jgi:hypothetical protein